MKVKYLINKEVLLQKFPGKGGWTYAVTPEIKPNPKMPFGWVVVQGFIDDCELKQQKLQPMGNGTLFLSVNASIRKQIKKQAGDYVTLKLALDNSKVEIPEEIILCFKNEPKAALHAFKKLTQGQQKTYLDWIYKAKTEETKANRIAKMMMNLVIGKSS